MNLNKVILAGRLTQDPEIKYTTNGLPIADLSLAVNHYYRDTDGEMKTETDFVNVTAFGRTAETIGKHLRKASPVYIDGHLKLDQWDDKQTGAKRSKLKVVADQMQFVGPKPQAAEAPTPSAALVEQRARQAAASGVIPRPAPGKDTDLEPDDIPF